MLVIDTFQSRQVLFIFASSLSLSLTYAPTVFKKFTQQYSHMHSILWSLAFHYFISLLIFTNVPTRIIFTFIFLWWIVSNKFSSLRLYFVFKMEFSVLLVSVKKKIRTQFEKYVCNTANENATIRFQFRHETESVWKLVLDWPHLRTECVCCDTKHVWRARTVHRHNICVWCSFGWCSVRPADDRSFERKQNRWFGCGDTFFYMLHPIMILCMATIHVICLVLFFLYRRFIYWNVSVYDIFFSLIFWNRFSETERLGYDHFCKYNCHIILRSFVICSTHSRSLCVSFLCLSVFICILKVSVSVLKSVGGSDIISIFRCEFRKKTAVFMRAFVSQCNRIKCLWGETAFFLTLIGR